MVEERNTHFSNLQLTLLELYDSDCKNLSIILIN